MFNNNDDFFTSEYNKLERQRQSQQANGGGYYHPPAKSKTPVAVWIVLVCVLVVVSFLGGFFISRLFLPTSTEGLLNEVIQTIEQDLLWGDQITDEDKIAMIEQAGTAMLQSVDDYGRLMSPQTAYNWLYPKPATGTGGVGNNLYFGFTYYYTQYGLQVSSIYEDSASYGKLKEGDLIVSFSDCFGIRYISNVKTEYVIQGFDVSGMPYADLVNKIATIYRCKVHVLRGANVLTYSLVRAPMGNANNPFYMVDYYFGPKNTNLSTTPKNGATISVVDERGLDNLPSNVGYIKLKEFSHYQVGGKTITAEGEFKQALDKFKASGKTKLIVDLKGNPGGLVSSASNIVGMLATTNESKYLGEKGGIIACTLEQKQSLHVSPEKYVADTNYMLYNYYFGRQDGNTKDIVVWTDGNSASSSEVTLGALLDYGTAIQMGTRSFGKGIAQVPKPLPYTGTIIDNDGNTTIFNWHVYYTVSATYSPKHKNIHGVGFTPQDAYNNLDSYDKLVSAVISYWG